MQCGGGVTARRGLARGLRTRTFTLLGLRAALDHIACCSTRYTVYVEPDAEGYVSGARGESAALVAACARPAPPSSQPPAARPRLHPARAGHIYLELTASLAPHHDLTVWPPPLHLLLLPPPITLTLALPSHSTGGVVVGEESEPREKGHECGYCGRRYSRRYGLRIHERTHTGARPLRCPHCARAFADPSNLNKHVRLHRRDAAADGGAVACPRCPRRLARRRDLLRHLRSHDDDDDVPRVK